ncbi:Prorelaxin, partial [Galemys pyrenaicus]
MDETVKVCGREYVRLVIEVCGSSYRKRTERGLRLGISSEHMAEPSSSLLEDLESTLSESHPSRGLQQSAPKDANLIPEEFKRNLPPRRDEDENDSIPELQQLIFDKHSNEAENNENKSLPKLQNFIFDKHSRKRRQMNKTQIGYWNLILVLLKELESTLSESQPLLRELQKPALKDANLNSEDFKRNLPTRLNETENNENDSLSEPHNLTLDKDFQKRRQLCSRIGSKCC